MSGPAARAFHEEKALDEKSSDLQHLLRLWPFLRPHGGTFFAGLAMILAAAALNLGRPLVMGRIVESAQSAAPSGLMRYGFALSLLVIATQALAFSKTYAMQIAGARAMTDLRSRVFEVLNRLALRYYDGTPIGRLVSRATGDVDAVGELFASGAFNSVGDLLSLVGIVVMMLALDVRMSLIAFASIPVTFVLVAVVRRGARRAFREIREKTARLQAFLGEQVSGMSVVQAYAKEREMAREFDVINAEQRDAQKRAVLYEAMLDAAVDTVSTVCVASVLWWAAFRRLEDPTITFALVVTFTQFIKQFFEPVGLLAQRFTVLQAAMAGAERVFQLLDEEDLERDAPPTSLLSPSRPPLPDEAVALDGVTFAYKPGVPVLRDVTIKVRRGERIALVGATGAGKTTITSVLLRLYEISSGIVRVLGKDVRAYPLAALRAAFSVVPQDVFLFEGTIASNVAMGDATPDLARVQQALERVGALEVLARRPGGLDAEVSDRGANFSAGERQLLAFARALYRDAPILILDEATANIDSETEARLQRAVDVVTRGRTALVIAHRLSTIRSADRIVVMHRGAVVEMGTHDQLLAREGFYARLYRLQFAVEEQRRLLVDAS